MKNSRILIGYCLLACLLIAGGANAQITATVTTYATTCGTSNGSAVVTASGGGRYTYAWSAGTPVAPNNDTVYGLAAGSYTVTVTSGANTTTTGFTITASTVPVVSIAAASDSFCLRSSDVLTASCNVAGGSYAWSGTCIPGGTSTANPVTAQALSAGATYTVTVGWTDGTCTATATKTISTYPFAIQSPLITMPTCGKNNGTITCATIGNSQGVFIKNGALVQPRGSTTYTTADAGTYTFIAYDLVHGCSDTITGIVLTDNSVYPVITSIQINSETCFGKKKGAAYVTLSNCTGGCSYSWSLNPADVTDSAVGLAAGVDTFHVSLGGCRLDTAIIIPGPTARLIDSLRIHRDNCHKGNGSAIVVTHGGTQPYSYSWNINGLTTDSISSLLGDTNLVAAIADASGCVDTVRGRLTSTPSPHAQLSKPDTICASENTGSIIAVPTGQGPFTYLWSHGGQTTQTAVSLPAGAVTVTVTDAVGCDTVVTGYIPYFFPNINLQAIPRNFTPGQTVELVTSTSVRVRSVSWSPYLPYSTDNLIAYDTPSVNKTYTVTVTYGNACTLTDTVSVYLFIDTSQLYRDKFQMPNTFTPNNDGINDNFYVVGHTYTDVSSFHIWIFDRWGNKMFESTDIGFEWDGTNTYAGNEPLSTGVFSYVVEFTAATDGKKRTIGGNISLVK
jgi:gliding motility-associated-like protein